LLENQIIAVDVTFVVTQIKRQLLGVATLLLGESYSGNFFQASGIIYF